MSDIGSALIAGMRAAPSLDPSMLYGIAANTPDPGDVPDIAQSAQAFGEISKRATFLRGMDANQQIQAWSATGDTERQLLTQAGYTPPAAHHGGGGLGGMIGSALGDVGSAVGDVGKGIASGVGDILHVAGAPLRAVQHAYRTFTVAAESGDNNLLNALFIDRPFAMIHDRDLHPGLSLSLSPSDWARMWRETEHGEQTFSPHAERDIRKNFSPDTADLAKQLASTNPNKVILSVPEEQRQALAQRIATDQDLKAAVTAYQAAKITLGHQILGPDLTARMQVTLPKAVPLVGGATFNPISGAIDATADWFGDPLVIGTKTLKGAELARYAIQGPEDVQRLAATNTNVQRAIADVADTLNSGEGGNAAALMRRWPKLAPVAEQLVKEGVDSPEKFQGWLEGQNGMASMLSGRAGGMSKEVPQMLKLNVREAAMLNLKGGLRSAIDWAADTPLGIASKTGDEAQAGMIRQFLANRVQGIGRVTRQATSLTARGATFDPTAPNAVTTIQRLANYVLPADRVDDIVNAWTAAPDLAKKRDIYKSLLGEMADASGVTASEEGRQWLAKFTSAVDDSVTKPVYSASGADVVVRDGVEAKAGLLENQLTTEWAMPAYKELWAQAKRVNTLGRLYQGTVNSDGVTTFMERAWKPSTLLRLGFPIRAGGEELVAAIMREGPLGLLRGFAARGAAKGEALGEADRLLPFHPLSRIWNHYTSGGFRALPHLGEDAVARLETPADFVGAVIGDRTRRAFRTVEGALAPDEYMQAARDLWQRGPLQSAFLDEVSAVHGHAAGGYLDDPPTMLKAARSGDNPRPAYFAPVGGFKNYTPTDSLYAQMWRKNLDEAASSRLAQAALANIDDPEAARQAVADVIDSPGFAKMRARASRSLQTSDGRLVGVDATATEATDDWARAVVDHVNSLVRDPSGEIVGDLPSMLAGGEVPTVPSLSDIPADRLPSAVKGREVVQVSRNWVRDIMDRGFSQVVGRPMDWMVRQPLFIHNYAVAQKEAEAIRGVYGVEAINNVPDISVTSVGRGELNGAAARGDWRNSSVRIDEETLSDGYETGFGRDPIKQDMYRRLGTSPAELKAWFEKNGGFAAYRDFVIEHERGHVALRHLYAASMSDAEKAAMETAATDYAFQRLNIPLSDKGRAAMHADELVHQVAMERAVNKTIPFIHDPQLRSQMAVNTRNLSPFWFAQEQFYKRWAKILVHSPESFRQAQLVMSGFRHSGVLHTDDQGNDYFIYPGPSIVQNVLSKGFEAVTGHKVSLPLPVGFSGQVRFATPGLERLGVPSFGPLVGIPVHYMASRYPELQGVEQGVLGDRGAGRAYWEMITPTTIARLVHIATDNPDNSPQMASAMMQAIQYLEAAGYSPADNASPPEQEAFIDRVKNWTRILFLNRTLFGFAAPAAPDLQMDPNQLHQEFRDLMTQMPIDQAVGEFIRRHPDATPYTVFQSKSTSGAPLPATTETASFMETHKDFLETYPQASGWFLPQTAPADSKFNTVAYREQLAMALRQRKDPVEFYRNVKYAEAADTYFNSRDTKDKALVAAKGNSVRSEAIRSQWAQWKAAFLTAHPVFAEEIQSPDATIRRQQTIDQLHQAAQDPRLPQGPQTDATLTMLRAYDQVQAVLTPLAGRQSSAATRVRTAVKTQFRVWGEQYIADHPEAKPLWDRTFRFFAEAD